MVTVWRLFFPPVQIITVLFNRLPNFVHVANPTLLKWKSWKKAFRKWKCITHVLSEWQQMYLVDLRPFNLPPRVSHTIGYLAFLQHLIVSWCMLCDAWWKYGCLWKSRFPFETSWQVVHFPLCPHWCLHPDFICDWYVQSCSAPSGCSCAHNWKDVRSYFFFFFS